MELLGVGSCLVNIGRRELLVLTLWGMTLEMDCFKLERYDWAGTVTLLSLCAT